MLAISLVKSIADRIQLAGNASKTGLAYFFCDNKDDRRKTGTSILRGLIYQMLCQRPDLCFYLRDSYDKQKEQLFNSPNSLQSLWRIFQNIVRHESLQRVYIVIDALDECEAESLELLINHVDPYQEAKSNMLASEQSENDYGKVKWLFTSRNEVMIKQLFSESLDISLETNRNQVEYTVRKFIDVKVKQLQRRKGYDADLKCYVENQLRKKAEGTFLWVSLACRELSRPSVLSVNTKKVLIKLPSGLTPLYGRILEQVVESEDIELVECAKSILRSMVIAFRPLTLNEIAIAANLPEEHRHNLPALGEYVSQCGSMVTLRDHTAYFVHLSAKTYILSMTMGNILSTDPKVDHQFLALNCFEYVCGRLSQGHAKTAYLSGAEKGETEAEYPMLFWTDHVRESPVEIAQCLDLQREFFQPQSIQRQAWFKIYWEKTHAKWEAMPTQLTAMHLASYAGLPSLLDSLLVTEPDPNISILDSLGNSPLLLAAKYGHYLCVRMLLKAGADTAQKNLDSMTPLQWAAGNGHRNIVELLFDKGASIDTADKNGWTPLHRAAYNGHTNVVQLLLDLGADSEALDGSTWTALHRASSSGQVDVVRLLIERQASIYPLDREGMTPMLHAAWAGHLEVIDLHLRQNAVIDVSDHCGWTAIHNAAWNGHIEAIRFLLRRGANVHARNGEGTTALHHATWSGHAKVVEILLEAGAEVNAKDDEGETPLQQAAWRGHSLATQALLAMHDVDVNMTNNVGHTALHQASSSGQESVVHLLLNAGADPTILDKHGQSARALAEANEHDSVAAVIKQHSRDLDTFSRSTTPPVDQRPLDPAVAEALFLDPTLSTVEPHQAAGFFVPEKITTFVDGKVKYFYMKSGSNREMFESEYLSLSALHTAVPTLAPRPLAWGKFADTDAYYLATEWIDVETRDGGTGPGTGLTLAQKVAKLHTAPVPLPIGRTRPVFGFPMRTYCGSTPQPNTYTDSWVKFFADHRLRAVARIIEENHSTDEELTTLLDKLISAVVPRLLRNGHLGGKNCVQPVLIHGDLWEGNKAKGRFGGRDGIEPVTFDPSCCWAHSEFELGLMRMFGGFSAGFFNEYHHLVPKTDPKAEYDDRMELYEL